jgi:phage tail protein X
MALNTAPIYSGVGDIQWGTTALTQANPSFEASGSGAVTIFTASVSGSFVQRVRFKASGSTTATAARVFIANAGTPSTGSNVVLFDEVTLPTITVSSTAAQAVYELPMNIALPPNYKIVATVATQQATGGWYVSAVGGSYTTP